MLRNFLRTLGRFYWSVFVSNLCVLRFALMRRQAYKINLVFEKDKLVMNSLTVRYFRLDLRTYCCDPILSKSPSRNLRQLKTF